MYAWPFGMAHEIKNGIELLEWLGIYHKKLLRFTLYRFPFVLVSFQGTATLPAGSHVPVIVLNRRLFASVLVLYRIYHGRTR